MGRHLQTSKPPNPQATNPSHLEDQEGVVDASVVGAALQRCGHSLWWKALLEVYDAKARGAFGRGKDPGGLPVVLGAGWGVQLRASPYFFEGGCLFWFLFGWFLVPGLSC